MSRPERRRRRGSTRVRSVFSIILLVLIGSFVVWVGFNYLREVLRVNLLDIKPASYGVVQKTLPFEGLLVRDETVLTTTAGGKIEIVAPEGERVRVGAVVSKVKTPDVNNKGGYIYTNIRSPRAGIVCYYTDGLESILSPGNLDKIDLMAASKDKNGKVTNRNSGQEVEGGSPVVKVVNNLNPMYIVGEIEKSKIPLSKLEPTKQLMVLAESAEEPPLYLNVVEAIPDGDKLKIILEMNSFGEEFMRKRTHDFTLVLDRYEGYVVPSEAIISKEGKVGIYTIYKNSVRWQSVEIIGEVGSEVAISGLSPDSSYVANPQYAKEGQVID